jgi:DNA polymerase III delta subunit
MSIIPECISTSARKTAGKKKPSKNWRNRSPKCNGEPPEKHRLYAFESDSEAIFTLVQNGSLFAAHTLVIVNNAEALNKKADVTSLVNYIKNPNQSATLVLLSDEKQDRNQDPKGRAQNPASGSSGRCLRTKRKAG